MNKIFANQVYAGLFEILKDSTFYYYSKIGDNYCHLTPEGEKAVLEWVNLVAPEMHELHHRLMDERAKQLVIEGIKK